MLNTGLLGGNGDKNAFERHATSATMDIAIRTIAYLGIGLLLLAANYVFLRAIHRSFIADVFVIDSFNVLGDEGTAAQSGRMLAGMLKARLDDLQDQLREARGAAEQAEEKAGPHNRQPTAALLIIPQVVDIPTGMLEPVNINVTVAGVEVGGVFAWLQKSLSRRRTLSFTVLEKGDSAVISANLEGFFDSSNSSIWIESAAAADEIATNIAFALIQRRLAEQHNQQVASLDLSDFRTLLNGLLRVDSLNRKVREGHLVDKEFAELLPSVEALSSKVPDWHELTYLVANIADSAGNRVKATKYFDRLQHAARQPKPGRPRVNTIIVQWVEKRAVELGGSSAATPSEAQRAFTEAMAEFSTHMGLKGEDPILTFVAPKEDGVVALWDEKNHRIEVSSAMLDFEGLPQYVALMGRFMSKNLERCFGDEAQGRDSMFWTEFRDSTIDYLVQSDQKLASGDLRSIGERYPLYRALKKLETPAAEPVKRLALELLERYECDWSSANIEEKVIEISNERGLFTEAAVRRAFTSSRQ